MYKVAYNTCYGGFNISADACVYLYKKFGISIDEKYGYIDDILERHDQRLIQMIEALGEDKASGRFAKIKIAEIDSPMYKIDEYDGLESVETPDSTSWIVIK